MRFFVQLEPQEGLSYADILAVAHRVEELGFDGLYRSDHYTGGDGTRPVASTDAWATLAGLARETDRIVLGTLVSPVTFRPVGNLAKVVATVAEMAGRRDGGPRVHLGLGTGWHEIEHRQHGFPFEDRATRFRRLEEHLRILRGFWGDADEPFSSAGEFERIDGARFAPKPEPRPRLIVGGTGRTKTPRLAARHADEMNVIHPPLDECAERRADLDRFCEEAGRDPATVRMSAMVGYLVGEDAAAYRRRAEALHARLGKGSLEEWLGRVENRWIAGHPEQAADHVGRLAEAGVDAVMIQFVDLDDTDSLELIAKEVAPRVR